MLSKITHWLLERCPEEDYVTAQRMCILVAIDVVALVLSLTVGLIAVFYLGTPIAAPDAWTSFAVFGAAAVSLAFVVNCRYEAAAHMAVALGFAAIWAQVFGRTGVHSTHSAVVYVMAALLLPALLLGRRWTLVYAAVTVVLAGMGSAHLRMARHYSQSDAMVFFIDIVAGAAFVVFVTAVLSSMYEKALEQVRSLLSEQQECNAMLTSLADSLQKSEAHKRQFFRETIYSVTGGKLRVCDEGETDAIIKSAAMEMSVPTAARVSAVRHRLTAYCSSVGLLGDPLDIFTTAVGEALTNAIKHAGCGTAYAGTTAGRVWVAVTDHGPGIESLILPRAVLMTGFSTKPSLGIGYTLMLDGTDEIALETGNTGTKVVLLKDL